MRPAAGCTYSMSDLEPHLHTPVLEDPAVTRLMLRDPCGGRHADLLRRAGAVATSMSVVLTEQGEGATAVVASLAGWRPEHVRVELLVMDGDGDPGRRVLREQLAEGGRPWRPIARPLGGRAASLAAAACAAENEFILIGTRGCPAFPLVEPALSWMWAEGADVALIAEGAVDPADGSEDSDPSRTVARWLGLAGPVPDGGSVLMRRWVARWLFNEITRAISPADEVADRARLLGIGIVQIASFSSDAPLRD